MNNSRIAEVLIVDDHPIVRQGLWSLLSQYPFIHVVGEANDISSALNKIQTLKPDIVLLDIRLGNQSGIDVAQHLRRMDSPTRVIILTSYDDKAYISLAAQAGVYGYLSKNASPELLVEAIQAVYEGERRLSPSVGGKVLEQLEKLSTLQVQAEIGLSNQELELLVLLAEGASTEEMTKKLFLSERTIKRKIQDVLIKLGAANRVQAVAEAFKRGLF
ncbi:MAG: response regulator transcription factor [Anaerolineales bacterium]|nr:response regulator transcription factor [Anaerolineales bacterium]